MEVNISIISWPDHGGAPPKPSEKPEMLNRLLAKSMGKPPGFIHGKSHGETFDLSENPWGKNPWGKSRALNM